MRYVLGSRASIGGVLGSGRGGAAAAAWYLAGGVSAANCVAAYAPKGAASYAASKINLANPGTYDAADGTAFPTWAAATGWTFAAASSQKLVTGITWAQTYTAIVRTVSPGVGGSAIGALSSGAALFLIQTYRSDAKVGYWNGNGLLVSPPAQTDSVLAIAGATAYRNGSAESGTIATAAGTWGNVFIGAANATTSQLYNGSVLALAIYNTTLTAPQVAAISSAMSAL